MAHPDDWVALIRATRALPPDRTFDYISTLTARARAVERGATQLAGAPSVLPGLSLLT
jgi:hypothetical protein